MDRENQICEGEIAIDPPPPTDAGLVFIGRIRTPWTSRLMTPHYGRPDGPVCQIEISEQWRQALDGIDQFERLEVLYWLHKARRDLVKQSPDNNGIGRGTFSLRSPVRPNPIGTSIVGVVGRDGLVISVRGLDCLDGTPLLDLKPDRTLFKRSGTPTYQQV